MRESTARGPAIDLSEFERRLRSANTAPKAKADPLSELARLMEGEGQDTERSTDRHDRVAAVQPGAARAEFTEFSEWAAQSRKQSAPRAEAGGAVKLDENALAAAFRGSLEPDAAEPAPAHGRGSGVAHQAQPYLHPTPPPAAYRQELAPEPHQPPAYQQTTAYPPPAYPEQAYHPSAHQPQEYFDADPHADAYRRQDYPDASGYAANPGAAPHSAAGGEWADDPHSYADYGQMQNDTDLEQDDPEPDWARRWPRFKPWHAIVGVAGLAVVSIGWGFAHRGGAAGPRDIATIEAPDGPVKLPPAAEVDQSGGGQGAAVLDRNQSAPVNKLVTHEERALDPKVVQLGDGPVDAPHEPAPPGRPEAKKVKTVSVRPDGTVIENESVPPAVAKAADAGTGDGALKAETGKNGGTPKSTAGAARPATTPRADKSAGADQTKPKPAPKVAAVEENGAAAETAPPSKVSGGSFEVQFGAANTESEARALMTSIAGKYRAQLGGRRPTFKIAKVGGKTVYRVRVGGVSKESATGICEKVKSSGGGCFIAGN